MSERARDDALCVDMIRTVRELARPGRDRLPHPLVTDARFAGHLDDLTASVARLAPTSAARSAVRRARSITGDEASGSAELHGALESIVHALHQLDHRTKATRIPLDRRIVRPRVGGPLPTLAVVKPSWGTVGGFERLLHTLVDALAADFDITMVDVDAVSRPERLFGLPVDDPMLSRHDAFFLHAALIERIDALDLSAFDVVLTTQPSTYLVHHPRKVGLFYHQPRAFYDLEDAFVDAGYADDALHRLASETIREMELDRLDADMRWLAGSATVAERLRRWWSIEDDRIAVYRAAPPSGIPDPAPPSPDGPIVMVSRHSWPKRTELAIAAIHASTSDRELVLIGAGERLERARSLDAELGAGEADPTTLDAAALWQHTGVMDPDWTRSSHPPSGRVRFVTDADDAERDRLVASASVVLCLAHAEDHGLTPIEAMALGRPVITCADGGGLLESVTHDRTGLVVDPTPTAIAAAIDELVADPDRAAALGRAGRAEVEAMSWSISADEVASALHAALADD